MEQIENTEKIKQMEASVPEALRSFLLETGAFRAELIDTDRIVLDAEFRKMCESNACGNYGRNYMCPPDAGDIQELMAQLRTYRRVLVYQTVSALEDSYDFEGMMEAGKHHNELAQKLRALAKEQGCEEVLHLGAGGCHRCEVCGKITGEPCRYPDQAMRSLETYGVNVSELAKLCGMRYINGQDTVTYFGAMFFDREK